MEVLVIVAEDLSLARGWELQCCVWTPAVSDMNMGGSRCGWGDLLKALEWRW